MQKLARTLNKHNKKYLYKLKESKITHKKYQKDLGRQGLNFKLKDEEDLIRFEIIKTSYENMRKIQSEFFKIKHDLEDLWDNITYKERHFLVYKKLEPFMQDLKHFYVEDKRYYIAYFDDLLNAYYDHEILMFDKEAFRKFIYDFKDLVIDVSKYNIKPLMANFSQVRFICGDKDAYVLYSSKVNRFYYYGNHILSFGLSSPLEKEMIKDLGEIILKNDVVQLHEYLINNQLGSKRLLKRLNKRLRKL